MKISVNYILGGVGIALAMLWFYIIGNGISHPVTDMYWFRQSQTALSAYWMIEEGVSLAYITPVLGAPWSIPFEFPLYQFFVAILTEISNAPLDVIGRLVSIVFFLATLPFVWRFLVERGIEPKLAAIPVFLVCFSPLYLFWTRTFMIESTALFFGVVSIFYFNRALYCNNKRFLIIAIIAGILGALTKVTSYAVMLSFMACLTLEAMWSNRKVFKELFHAALKGLIVFAIPVLIAVLWNDFADTQKSSNPLAQFIVSENLTKWNFGSLDKKMDPQTWVKILSRADYIIGDISLMVIGFIAFIKTRFISLALASLLAFVAGPLVFTNLYYVHDYYFYANALFLLLFIGLGIVALLEDKKFLASAGILAFTCLVMAICYINRYPALIKHAPHSSWVKAATAAKELTEAGDLLLIYGADWDSTLTYYAQRKSIMDIGTRSLDEEPMRSALENIRDYTIGAMMLCDYSRQVKGYTEEFIQSRISYFGLQEEPVRAGKCNVYPKAE